MKTKKYIFKWYRDKDTVITKEIIAESDEEAVVLFKGMYPDKLYSYMSADVKIQGD